MGDNEKRQSSNHKSISSPPTADFTPAVDAIDNVANNCQCNDADCSDTKRGFLVVTAYNIPYDVAYTSFVPCCCSRCGFFGQFFALGFTVDLAFLTTFVVCFRCAPFSFSFFFFFF